MMPRKEAKMVAEQNPIASANKNIPSAVLPNIFSPCGRGRARARASAALFFRGLQSYRRERGGARVARSHAASTRQKEEWRGIRTQFAGGELISSFAGSGPKTEAGGSAVG